MKTVMTSILFSLFFFLSEAKAQYPQPIKEALQNESMATVIIYRTPQYQGAARNWAIFEGGERLCKLSNKKYMIYQREPGESDFRAQVGGVEVWPKKVTGVNIPLEAGGIYFIKTNLKISFTRARVELVEVVERTALQEMKELTLDNCSQ